MISKNITTALLLWTGLLLALPVLSQDETPATRQDSEKATTSSQETEYTDDNYRRFMELKDQPTHTSTLPTNSYQSGTEKLDELPEESQKHLRNQLREIILENDEWAPGDENGKYPFVASEAGEKSTELKQQELEAWGELVGKYHEREAEIYANAVRSNSAAGTQGGRSDAAQAQANAGESAGSKGSGAEQGDSESEQKQAGQEGEPAQDQAASNERSDSSSSSTSAKPGDPNAVSTSGVSQSALEYLTGNSQKQNQQQQAAGSESGQPGSPSEQSTAQQTSAQQAMAQQQASADSAMAESQSQESQSQSQQQSAQQQRAEQQGQQQDQQQATQQDASEFVVISKGTLSIKELQNARGITTSTGGNLAPVPPPRKKDDG